MKNKSTTGIDTVWYNIRRESYTQFTANCKLDKFSVHIFNPQKPNGKKQLFEELGYDTMDTKYLVDEFCRQAKEKYRKGDFVLNLLNDYGQRINFDILVPSKDGKFAYTIRSGWMVCPNGTITNATPCRGEINERVQ